MRVACVHFIKEVRLQEFAQSCIRFSPQISVSEPNTIFIEIGKCLNLYSETSFIARAQVLVRRFKTEAAIAIANDLPSSLALARFHCARIDNLPIDALEDFADPFRSDPEGRKSITKMIDSLKRMGIKTVAQFRIIPISHFPSRFGALGLYTRQRIEGTASISWRHWDPPENYVERMELLPSELCADLEPLLFKAKEILDRLFSRLRGKFLRSEQMQVTLELERYSTVKNQIREWTFEFISPQGSTSGFLPILRERLSRDLEREPIESFVTAMKFEATATVVGNTSQRNFFHSPGHWPDNSNTDWNEAMGSLYGQLEEFLGRDRVFWARITEERFPEKSWIRTKKSNELQTDVRGRYPLRPTRLFNTPIPITVIEDRIRIKGRIYKTLRWSQLERIALDWLDDTAPRNYYRVDLDRGRALWVFSDPDHHYFVHGYFE